MEALIPVKNTGVAVTAAGPLLRSGYQPVSQEPCGQSQNYTENRGGSKRRTVGRRTGLCAYVSV